MLGSTILCKNTKFSQTWTKLMDSVLKPMVSVKNRPNRWILY